jgi:cellulose synthase/poly-beta-1,6-N-acetylglucosamine synthase-like glycosyltransferase
MTSLTTFIQVVLLIAFMWSAAVTLFGLSRGKKQLNIIAKPSRFAILICAHNEETVIGKLLASLNKQNYPRELYTIFLFADHCTDKTAQIGTQTPGVVVYERQDGPRSGKGAVLRWGIDQIKQNYGEIFDNIVVFDADNVADPDFLLYMNESFAAGAQLVMGNRLALNPYASTISGWYTLYWQTVDYLYCLPRSNLGMSAILSGTGFGFAYGIIKNVGWETSSITEDIEFCMQQNLKGVFAVYQNKASFYDEQPTDMKTLISQLRRWCTGNYQIFHAYRKPWCARFFSHPDMRLLDNAIPIGLCCAFGFYLLLSVAWLFYNLVRGGTLISTWDLIWWGGLYALSVFIGAWSTYEGKFSFSKMLPSILTSGLYCIIFSLVAVYSVFFPVHGWQPIKHKG